MSKTPENTAAKILEDNMVGTMATIEGNKPHARYMTFFNDNFTLYTATSKDTHKVEELSKNPHTHILIGYDGKGLGDEYLEIAGEVEISNDDAMREKVWNNSLKDWFTGPHDPKMVILKVTPTQIKLMNTKGKDPVNINFL
ncbi:pyridoxamine 5'-phosphate oxidase family protein [Ureibacillus aquaedulcis]|uniref:Pyridoxamine 5'-phosphate oxidase family protein n=1 Tax=Ureibacillus aquaedulcis TaxID=3058421 RepID=A0ABT8GPJ7_9BACL|nr:pyridoxamine 5'-phosphate oxidase family protein [Ureibacillus sp. BA0131]MDN4493279.1 pyridoxamine 5'-phosphate oxidase family protein [Ureibacillus sp. BA0131]